MRERERRERESPLFLVLFHFSTDYTHIYLEFYSGFIYINIVSYRQKIERERERSKNKIKEERKRNEFRFSAVN